ncbi:MAG: hypothetical protein KDD44_08920, partial [Bdellovibrionales bacterium]|nr:hypothetical protein [Bdellovibrionales bacterium]
NTPPSAIVVTNVVTSGSFHVVAHRRSLTEGHQPMLRPSLLGETLEMMAKVRLFFEHPTPLGLTALGADLVVVSHEKPDLGGTLLDPGFAAENHPAFLCRKFLANHVSVYSPCREGGDE